MKSRLTHPAHLAVGLGLWMLWFATVYAAVSVACALAPPDAALGARNWVNLGLLTLTLPAAVLPAWAALRCWRSVRSAAASERFFAWVNAAAYAGAALATVVVGLPLAWLPTCV